METKKYIRCYNQKAWPNPIYIKNNDIDNEQSYKDAIIEAYYYIMSEMNQKDILKTISYVKKHAKFDNGDYNNFI